MYRMATTIKFNVSEDELERIEKRVEEAGVSRASYIRHRYRAGELLWTSGELDGETLTKIAQEDSPDSLPSEENKTPSGNNHPTPPDQDLKEAILPEIPHKRSGDGISEEELKQIVFGTEEERDESISQAIESLYDERITRRADGLLVRIGE
jgi:hypothetical protein